MLARILTLAGAFCLASGGNAAEILGTGFNVGNWTGAAHASDETGTFSHCATSVDFVTGDTLRFEVHADATVGVAMSSPNFAFTPGQQIPLALIVDVRRPMTAIATAVAANALAVSLPDFGTAMNVLTRGRSLRIEGKDTLGHFDLAGAFRALEAARHCALRQLNLAAAGVLPETVPTPVEEVPAAPLAADITPDRAMLARIAEAMVEETGAKHARFLDAPDSPEMSADEILFWDAPDSGISGGVAIKTFAGDSLRATDRDDLQLVSARCQGTVATDARALPVEGFDAREIRSVCVTNQGRVDTLLAKLLVGGAVLRTILTFSEEADVASADSRRSLGLDVAHRAAKILRAP